MARGFAHYHGDGTRSLLCSLRPTAAFQRCVRCCNYVRALWPRLGALQYAERTNGSFVILNEASVVFNHFECDPEFAQMQVWACRAYAAARCSCRCMPSMAPQANELADHLESVVIKRGAQASVFRGGATLVHCY